MVEFADLLTDRTVYRQEAEGLKFGRSLSDSAEISGTLTVDSPERGTRIRDLEPMRTALYVYDGRDLVAGGVLWDDPPQLPRRGQPETWAFAAATFESYWHNCVIREDIPAQVQVDQLEIARVLVRHLQDDATADLGIQLDPAMSGVLRDRTEYLASANKSYGEALSELGEVQDGFEWTVDVWVDPGTGQRVKYLRLGYPIIGSGAAPIVLEGDAIAGWSEPSLRTGTRYWARGGTPQGAGDAQQQPLMSDVHAADDLLAAGWPRVDIVDDYSTVTDADTLNAHAAKALADSRRARAVPQISVHLDAVRIMPTMIGQTVRVRSSSNLRGRRDDLYRMVGITVDATQRGTAGVAQLTLEAA